MDVESKFLSRPSGRSPFLKLTVGPTKHPEFKACMVVRADADDVLHPVREVPIPRFEVTRLGAPGPTVRIAELETAYLAGVVVQSHLFAA